MTQAQPLYRHFASYLDAYKRCVQQGNDFAAKHLNTIKVLNSLLPHGAGLDASTDLDMDASSPNKLVFGADYHHMNDAGYYDGWTEHVVTVQASLQFGIDVSVSGRDRNQIKDYIAETFHHALTQSYTLKLRDENDRDSGLIAVSDGQKA